MYNIDKQAIGAFIAEMRREKGLTQKALAAQLCISDKAVSKWETATSVPGVDLLVPLSEALGVTVTELLMGQRIAQNPLDPNAVEQVVQSALTYSEETSPRAYQIRSPWGAGLPSESGHRRLRNATGAYSMLADLGANHTHGFGRSFRRVFLLFCQGKTATLLR